MISTNIVQVIAEYLDPRSLLQLGQVNRTFRKIAFLNRYWQTLLFDQFSAQLDMFGEVITGSDQLRPQFKSLDCFPLYKHLVTSFCQFTSLNSHFSLQDLKTLSSELANTLRNPLLPAPALRRESKNFATIIQDLIGNSIYEPPLLGFSLPTESEMILQQVVENEEQIKSEFCKNSDIKAVIKYRWGIKGKIQYRKGWIITRMIKVLLGCFKAHCRIVYRKLATIDNYQELMSEYCMRWEAYSASINDIEMIYAPVSRIMNQIYDDLKPAKNKTPGFSMLRLMMIVWRREVFEKLFKELIDGVLVLLQNIRKFQKEDKDFNIAQCDTEIVLVSRVILFIVDFSGNELSFQYIYHTKFNCEDCYLLLEQKINRVTEIYYNDLSKCSLASLKIILKNDFIIVSRILLPRSQHILQEMMLKTLITSYQNHYFLLYKEYGNFFCEDLPSDPSVYTAFGKMIFSNDHSPNPTKRIRGFFEYLKVKKLFDDVNEYNEIDARLEEYKNAKTSKDEEIEYMNLGIHIPLELSQIEKNIFSTYVDINYDLIEVL